MFINTEIYKAVHWPTFKETFSELKEIQVTYIS